MYVVVDIKGFQYKIEKGDKLRVPKFDLEVGRKVSLADVILVADSENISIGMPFVEGAVVEATITQQSKYKKIIVFKKKKRKDYSVKKGHRQDFTEIVVDEIKLKKTGKKSPKALEEKTTEVIEPVDKLVVEEQISEEVSVEKTSSEKPKTEKKAASVKVRSKTTTKKKTPVKAVPKKSVAGKATDTSAVKKKVPAKKVTKETTAKKKASLKASPLEDVEKKSAKE